MGVIPLVLAYVMYDVETKDSSKYNTEKRKLVLRDKRRVNLVNDLSHEYAHHIQFNAWEDFRRKSSFQEGHARGVQRYLCKRFHEIEDDDAFLYNITDENVGELKSAYYWMSEKMGLGIKQELTKLTTSRDSDEELSRKRGSPTIHAMGGLLFTLKEKINGSQIYKNAIKGNFDLVK